MKYVICAVLVIVMVSGCGRRDRGPGGVIIAKGPIADACLAAGRENATRTLCGCIQGVADSSLSARDQNRASTFFFDPQRAQDTRQSDNARLEAFWDRYKAFADRAEQTCRSLV